MTDKDIENRAAMFKGFGMEDEGEMYSEWIELEIRNCIPFYDGSRHMAFMLHGHTHKSMESVMEENIKEKIRRKGLRCEAYNVGAMWQDYEPQTLEEIVAWQHRKISFI